MTSIASVSSPKRRRLNDEEAAVLVSHAAVSLLSDMPDALHIPTCTYLDLSDIASLCRVATKFRKAIMQSPILWKELTVRHCGAVMEEVWQSLRNDDEGRLALLGDAALWRRIFESRVRSERSFMEEGRDYHDVDYHNGIPAFELDDLPDWIRPLPTYSFVVHVWKVDGDEKLSYKVQQPGRFVDSSIQLDLGTTSIGGLVNSGEFRALEIEVRRESVSGDGCSGVLYSSPSPLNVYGGGSFEQYSAMPWLEWEVRESQSIPERFDWLPFVHAKTHQEIKPSVLLRVEMQWRRRNRRDGRVQWGDDYLVVVGPMNEIEVLTMLNRLTNGHEPDSKATPRCSLQSLRDGLPTRDYAPKPLSAYSFILDWKDPTNNYAVFFERLSVDQGGYLQLQIPDHLFFDCAVPYYQDYQDVDADDFDTIFTVCVIDRQTGLQAKLYESTNIFLLVETEEGVDFDDFCLSHFLEFEKCAALTQFSNGSGVHTIPVPSTYGCLSLSTFFLQIVFLSCTAEGDDTYDWIRMPDEQGILAFLEKGLVYK